MSVNRAVRLVKSRHLATAFDGEGARVYGGRWNSPGTAVVYVSESLAVAMLEILVHVEYAPALLSYSCIEVEIPDMLVERMDEATLDSDWAQHPPGLATQAIGDRWVKEARSTALCVPSAVVPGGFNDLLNPGHPGFASLVLAPARAFQFDSRLLRAEGRL